MENIAINKRFQDLHFDSIQALRGLAALFVVFQHIRFLNFGAFGVDIFFCISGFMIMFTTEKSTKYFFRKRLIRILPLYYLMTLVTYLSLLLFPSMMTFFIGERRSSSPLSQAVPHKRMKVENNSSWNKFVRFMYL